MDCFYEFLWKQAEILTYSCATQMLSNNVKNGFSYGDVTNENTVYERIEITDM